MRSLNVRLAANGLWSRNAVTATMASRVGHDAAFHGEQRRLRQLADTHAALAAHLKVILARAEDGRPAPRAGTIGALGRARALLAQAHQLAPRD